MPSPCTRVLLAPRACFPASYPSSDPLVALSLPSIPTRLSQPPRASGHVLVHKQPSQTFLMTSVRVFFFRVLFVTSYTLPITSAQYQRSKVQHFYYSVFSRNTSIVISSLQRNFLIIVGHLNYLKIYIYIYIIIFYTYA